VADALAVAQNVDEGVAGVLEERSVFQVADAEEILKERDACGVRVDLIVAIRVAGTEFLLLQRWTRTSLSLKCGGGAAGGIHCESEE